MALKTISGSQILIQSDLSGSTTTGVPMAAATNAVLNVNQETIDVPNKESSGRKEFINGVKSWTMDCEAYALADGVDTNDSQNAIASLQAGTKIYIEFRDASAQAASKKYTGYGYITSISQTGAVNEWSTYSMSVQGTGQLTEASA